jgi:hypothetical protein
MTVSASESPRLLKTSSAGAGTGTLLRPSSPGREDDDDDDDGGDGDGDGDNDGRVVGAGAEPGAGATGRDVGLRGRLPIGVWSPSAMGVASEAFRRDPVGDRASASVIAVVGSKLAGGSSSSLSAVAHEEIGVEKADARPVARRVGCCCLVSATGETQDSEWRVARGDKEGERCRKGREEGEGQRCGQRRSDGR